LIYGFALFYVSQVIICTVSGKKIEDHYVIFLGVACAFLMCPRQERAVLIFLIVMGFLSYLGTLFLYSGVTPLLNTVFPPPIPPDDTTISLHNQFILYTVFITFTLIMIAGKYFMNQTEDSLMKEREKLAEMTDLLKRMFGRYLSMDVMNTIIENPASLELGGEKRRVTIMMTDLRGFTALAERLDPEQVVQMLNAYFEVMVEVILKYQGTINEIIGDALLVIFGAPLNMPDRTQRAVGCAIEMQNAMGRVNEDNRASGLPELEMGIGINESEVIVGNIGSSKRSKYAAVGSGVNMTSRIESYSVGGQILVSESVRKELGDSLRIDGHMEVLPKGAEQSVQIYEVGGISTYHLALEREESGLATLSRQIPLRYSQVGGKNVTKAEHEGSTIQLLKKTAEITLEQPVEMLTNVKMNLMDVEEDLIDKDFYGKVIERPQDVEGLHLIRFTSIPPEIGAYFQSHRQHANQGIG
jgi:adenylate cyclase